MRCRQWVISVVASVLAMVVLTGCSGNLIPGYISDGNGFGHTGNSANGTQKDDAENRSDIKMEPVSKELKTTKNGTEINYADSQTARWLNVRNNSSQWYIKTEQRQNNQKVVVESAQSGQNWYNKYTYENGTVEEYLSDGQMMYTLYPNLKMAVASIGSGNSGTTRRNEACTMKIKKETRVENSEMYYAEAMVLTGMESRKDYTTLYCYDGTGALAYIISEPNTANEWKERVLRYGTVIPETAILSIPEDWEAYTFETLSCGNVIVTDRHGNRLTPDEIAEVERKLNTAS